MMTMNKTGVFLFYFTVLIFVMAVCCISLAPDNDLWARLIAGKHIVETLSVLKNDFLSYTPTHNWYDHEWGASVFMYLALKYFSDAGLIFLKGILCALTVFITIKTVQIRKPENPYNIIYFVLMFIAACNSLGLITRCLLFTSLFFALFLYILEKVRFGKVKLLFLLPLIMLFWCNIHGGCIAGLGLIALYIIGEFLNKKPVKYYIYALMGCIAVLFVNPYGIEYVKFLFFAALMDRSMILEWQPSFADFNAFNYLYYKFYLFLMLFIVLIYGIRERITYQKLDKTKYLVILTMLILSILKVRHQAFFIFTAGALLFDEFCYVKNLLNEYFLKTIKINNNKINSLYNIFKNIIIYSVLILFSLNLLFFKSKQIRITESAYPRFAIEFIKINNLKGNLFVNFNWGSYAAYKLYPQNLIVMDGRYEEVYYPELLEDMKNFYMLKNDWDKIIKKYKTDILILENNYPVYEKIKNDPNWYLVFENNLSGVFVPKDSVKKEYYYPIPDDNYYNETKFETDIKF